MLRSSRWCRTSPTALLLVNCLQNQSKFCFTYLSSTQSTTGITAAQRASVIDNMVAAAASLGLDNDSLFLAAALLDRYLAARPAPLHLLQPTGIACLWAAAKYEQSTIPASRFFSQLILGRNGVPLGAVPAAQQLLVVLEQGVLSAVEFRLASIITAKAFKHCIMQRLCGSTAAAQLSCKQLDQLYCMVSYLSEVALLEYQLLPVQPSKLAAAAFGYAHVILGIPLSGETLQQLTQHSAEEIAQPMEYMCALHATLSTALRLGRPYAVTVKYCDPQVCSVAAMQPVVSSGDARVEKSW
jgi:cyclin A